MNRFPCIVIAISLVAGVLFATPSTKKKTSSHKTTSSVKKRASSSKHKTVSSPWKSPTYADSTAGDNVDGEDLAIRRAAVAALGSYNGSVAVVDPNTGRILSIVNQKLALKSGFQPCSTIKIVASLAAMREGVMSPDARLRLGRISMDFTTALAHSNNAYFATLGIKLGFERVSYYASLFGLGEKAGLDIEGEQPGVLPAKPPAGGVGMMTSFGEGISLTPLELAAVLSAVSNGGTLYYLQAPRTPEEVENFVPRIKRRLDISPFLDDLKHGMKAVTAYGTGRRAAYDPDEPVMGKTGTCTDYRAASHMGWFGSFNEVGRNKLVVVVMLTGGKSVSGPLAAGIAGSVYKNLSHQNFFASAGTNSDHLSLISTQACCAR